MKKTILPIVLGLAALLFAGLYFDERQRRAPDVAAAPAENGASEDVAALKARMAELERKLENKELEMANLSTQLGQDPVVVATETTGDWIDPDAFSSGSSNIASAVAKALPKISIDGLGDGLTEIDLESILPVAIKQRQALQHMTQVETTYADLFDQLHLGDEDREALRALLVDKSASGMSVFNLFGGEAETGKDKESKEDLDEEIKSLLGDEGFEQYTGYEITKKSRKAVNKLQGILAGRDLAMSKEQRQQMIDLHHAVQANREPSAVESVLSNFGLGEDINDNGVVVISSSGADEAQMHEALESRAAEYDQLLTGSSEFLEPNQVAELGKHFDRQMQKKEINAAAVQPLNMGGGEGIQRLQSISISIGGADLIPSE